MFNSTLKQLDQVEGARVEADMARNLAENMTRELSAINNEMVRVNLDLGANMQMLKDAQNNSAEKDRTIASQQKSITTLHEDIAEMLAVNN